MINKKISLSLLLMTAVIIAGCGKPSDVVKENEQDQTPPTTINQDVNPTNVPVETANDVSSTMTCEEAVASHLETAASFIGEGAGIENGDDIVIDYVGRLDKSTVFDTSIESVALACEKHNPYRNYQEGFAFTVGTPEVIAGFNTAVVGMKVNETKTVTIPAAQAYGEYDETKMQEVPLTQLPQKEGGYQAGDELSSPMGKVVVKEVTDEFAVIDINHELAGKDLIFDITVKEIK